MKIFSSIITSTLIFLFLFEMMCYIKFEPIKLQSDIKIDKKVSEFELPFKDLEEDSLCLDLLQNVNNSPSDCKENNIIDKNIESRTYTNYQLFNQLNQSRIVIKVIFLFLILSLSIQIYIYFLSLFNTYLDEKYFHFSELSINASPMLGLLGTFISISILLGKESDTLNNTLINGFFDAVITTIIGITFYLISLYLKAYIYPKIKTND